MHARRGDTLELPVAAPQAPAGGAAPHPDFSEHRIELPPLPTIRLHGVTIHSITEAQCIGHIMASLAQERGGVVVTPNLDHLRRCRHDVSFAALVAEADLVVADGMPLVWASRLQRTPLPQRVAGSDLISTVSAAAAREGRSIYLLGGAPGTADAAAAILTDRHPQLKVAGTYCPPIGFENDARELANIIEKLTAARPDVVFVALGSPKQEKLIERLRGTLPASWWLGVGVSFSFLCGDVRRAPQWMRKTGLEWIHRLVQEPRRLFKRYIVVGLPFASSLLLRATAIGIVNRFRSQPASGSVTAPESMVEEDETKAAARVDDVAPGGTPGAVAAAISALIPRTIPAAAVADDASGSPQSADNVVTGSWQTAGPAFSDVEEAPRMTELATSLSSPTALRRLRALVLLGGSVRNKSLSNDIARSVLDLPIDARETILSQWLHHAAQVADASGLPKLPVRVLLGRNAPEPGIADGRFAGGFAIERDAAEYRGSGGVLSNLATDYEDDDLILVANAAQVLLDPLTELLEALRQGGGDVGLIAHQDGTASGMMLLTCKVLRLIPRSGFVDMKEQALPAIAKHHDVRVVQRRRPTGLPVRSLSDYVLALRQFHTRDDDRPVSLDPLAEDWSPSFSLVEGGAAVDPSARVHDSVVLKGGVVEAGAVVVRSIVCPSGTVRKDRKAVDQVVTANSDRKNGKSR